MKFVHLSDLHLGKRIHEYSMIEDQEYILIKILNIVDEEKPDAVIIAGDVYDKSIPSTEAISIFDNFIVELAKRALHVCIISGNHDSPERISFGSRLMNRSGIHISPVYDGNVVPITFNDEYGSINIFMLPFIKPAHVRGIFDEEHVSSYTDAMRVAIGKMNINADDRNILVTHQFVTGASRSDSEDISVGGSDNVDVTIFDKFDYVALGHLHSPQNCSSERVRYCGTPLKYSFSEVKDEKSVTIIELKEKDNLTVKLIPLVPKRDLREIRGNYNDLMFKGFYENTSYQDDYMHIILTDEDDIPDAVGTLRTVYHHLLKLDYDNKRTRAGVEICGAIDVENKSPLQLFADFYELQNNQLMNDVQEKYVRELINSIWEGEK